MDQRIINLRREKEIDEAKQRVEIYKVRGDKEMQKLWEKRLRELLLSKTNSE